MPSPQSDSESEVEEEYDPSTASEEEIREDIAKVMKNPSTLNRLQHRKHPRVIIAAVRTRPNMLENILPSQGLTEDVVEELMKENGKWLLFVPKMAKTRFVCLTALHQTDKAIDFVPKEMKDNPSKPIFYEIIVENTCICSEFKISPCKNWNICIYSSSYCIHNYIINFWSNYMKF